METPTTALPVLGAFFWEASHWGSAVVGNVSHL